MSGLVDADGHIRDTEQYYRQYMESPYDKRGPVGVGLDAFDRAMFGTLGGPAYIDAQNWIDMLDQSGMETTVLFPTIGLGVGFLNDPDYATAFCRAYNNYVSEEFCKVSPRLKAVAILPLQVPDEAAKEIRRAVQDLGLVGGMLAAVFPELSGQLLTSFRPIFFGLALMLFLIYEPRGLAHRWQLLRAGWRLRPFSR